MKTDRELLELAAKAAGYTLVWGDNYIVDGDNIDCTDLPYVKSDQQDEADCFWNPLTDDGDALRLVVNLGLNVECLAGATQVNYVVNNYIRHCNVGRNEGSCDGDPYAATRRAIVRAAADIGESMP